MADPIRSGGENPFEYRKPNTDQVERIEIVRQACKHLYDAILGSGAPSRARSLAITRLEETSMWANKAIAFESTQAAGDEHTPVRIVDEKG